MCTAIYISKKEEGPIIKILVVSDIHYPDRISNIPDLSEYAENVNLIFATGDFTNIKVLEHLKSFNVPVVAVYGNMDSLTLKQSLSETYIIKIEGLKIGLYHGNGPPNRIEQRVKNSFKKKLDAYIFGHSHKPMNKNIDGAFYFNSGALSGRVPTLGFLYVDFGNIWGEIKKYGNTI